MKRLFLFLVAFWAAAVIAQESPQATEPSSSTPVAPSSTALAAPPSIPGRTPKPWDPFFIKVRPFLEQHCQSCHNSAVTSGNVNFEVLKFSQSAAAQAAIWEKMVYVLKMDQMPPQGMPRPSPDDVAAVVTFMEGELAKLTAAPAPKAVPATNEWLTWQGNPERTGWAEAEKTLSRRNAKNIRMLWKSQLDAVPGVRRFGTSYATLSTPLVAENIATAVGTKTVIYLASGENNVYALDAVTGSVIWTRKFPNPTPPPVGSNPGCPNNLNATPVIDKENNTLYVLTNDGKLRGLRLTDGEDTLAGEDFVKPYSRNWSLNLVDGMVYTSTSRGCAGAISSIVGMDVRDPKHPVRVFFPSTGKASGPWGKGGIVKSSVGMLAQTADGAYDPAGGRFGNTVLGFTRDLRLNDSFTPRNWDYLNRKDFDLGATSPTAFEFEGRSLVVTGAKEGVIYLLDAANLGGKDHMTPLFTSRRYGNDEEVFSYNGIWGSISTYVDAKGRRIVLVPMMGPPAAATAAEFKRQYGPVVNGSIMAFEVKSNQGQLSLEPLWMTHDLDTPGIPVAANGVVYAIGTGNRATTTFGVPGYKPVKVLVLGRPSNEVNVGEPGAEKDAAWLESQLQPGGQSAGDRHSGGMDRMQSVLYAFDAETGKQLYSSDTLIDSFNHFGAIAVAGGRIYVSTYDGRVFAFGLKKSAK